MPWLSNIFVTIQRPRPSCHLWLVIGLVLLVSGSALAQHEAQEQLLKPFTSTLTTVPATMPRSGAIYVPAYKNLPVGAGAFNVGLSVTLSIRNTSSDKVMAVRKIDYFDTSGNLLESYITAPIGLRPYGTVNLFFSSMDQRGGAGANFVIEWGGDKTLSEPVIEAIMLGDVGGRSYSWVSRGVATGILP